MARAMEIVGDRWTILILREAYYGVKRFDEFEYYVGVAPNMIDFLIGETFGFVTQKFSTARNRVFVCNIVARAVSVVHGAPHIQVRNRQTSVGESRIPARGS